MLKSLYNIEKEYLELSEQLIDNGGECSPEMEQALIINQQELETKGICYGFIIKTMESNVNEIDAEIKRLTALKSARNKSIERLKNNVKTAMEMYGIDKIETAILKINFRKSESTEITNEALIPAEYWTVKETRTVNKTAIKDAIKNGIDVQGACLQTNNNLQLK